MFVLPFVAVDPELIVDEVLPLDTVPLANGVLADEELVDGVLADEELVGEVLADEELVGGVQADGELAGVAVLLADATLLVVGTVRPESLSWPAVTVRGHHRKSSGTAEVVRGSWMVPFQVPS